jgi:hypothetical protein
VTSRTEIIPISARTLYGEFFRCEILIIHEDLGQFFHRIDVEFLERRLIQDRARADLDLDHESLLAGRGQVLAAKITRVVDHQRRALEVDITVSDFREV